jgi:hypothetical protein
MSNERIAKLKLEGFVYEHVRYDGEKSYHLLSSPDSSDEDWSLVGPLSLLVDYPIPAGWNPTAAKVAALEKEREEVKAEFARTVADLNERISKLQAITYEPEAA